MTAAWAIYSFFIGACFGSFLNVCISRWPDGLSVVRPRSRCPNCGHQITAIENIPIFSWLVLRGRCRGCRNPISFQYPLVEIIVGVVWMLSYLHYGLTFTAARVAMLITILIGPVSARSECHLKSRPLSFSSFRFFISVGLAMSGPGCVTNAESEDSFATTTVVPTLVTPKSSSENSLGRRTHPCESG